MKYLFIILNTLILLLYSSLTFADSRLDQCIPYYSQIVSILEREGVSSDYFYLAVCESGCRLEQSSKGARGFFQLMKGTFETYRDANCSDIDRLECNTTAAARYIKHLQKRFTKMYILIKAYNRGGTNYLRKGTTREADGLSKCVMRYVNNRHTT